MSAGGTNPIDRPIFIAGCHRTGTTLLQKSLSRHPDLDILPETKLLAWLYSPTGGMLRRSGREVIEFVASRIGRINREWAKEEHAWRVERLRENAGEAPPRFRDATSVMRHVLAHGARPEAQRVGEKTPLHVFHIDALVREFPDARFIITRRDLRGAYHSQATRNQTGSLSYRPFASTRFVASWLMAERLAKRAIERHGDNKIAVVRYEDLAGEPAGVFERLASFLGITSAPELLDARVENSSFESQKAGFSTGSIDRWREELPPRTIAELERLARHELADAGYELTQPKQNVNVQHRFERAKLVAGVALAERRPRLVCRLFRDPRYAQHGRYPRRRSDA